jgi:uncharacterized membrane protein YhhN
MDALTWGLLGLAAPFAVANWISRWRDDRRLEYVTKPTVTLLLLAVALTLDPVDPGQRAWFVAGLALSLAGDVFLMLPREQFVAGLASFLLAHVAYIVGFALRGIDGLAFAVGAGLVLLLTLPVGRRVVAALPASGSERFAGPIIVYMAVIGGMLACAIGTGSAWGIAGAALFLASDSVLAWNKFVRPLPFGRPAVMVTYHLAQTALVVSLLA